MAVARVAAAMLSIAIVLFTLTRFRSPELTGLVTFASLLPGLLLSPVAGALLDRHGRTRLVILGYLVGASSMALIGGLALADALPAWLLLCIAAGSSLTQPLTNAGLRSVFPIIVPEHLWSRVNAIDSNGYLAATLIGPPIAAVMVMVLGGPVTLMVIGAMLAAAAVILVGNPDPTAEVASTGSLVADSWAGLVYTWRNRTIRGLGLVMGGLNLAGGVLVIVVPVVVLDRLHESAALVGLAWAVAGACGMVTALWFGRLESRGREKRWMIWSAFGSGFAMALLLAGPSLPALFACMIVTGLCNGPLDIALFTLRQRRTDPAWMGRAIAVSASLNFSPYPIGSAITGGLVARSLEVAIAFGVLACLVATIFAAKAIPDEPAMSEAPEEPEIAGGVRSSLRPDA